MCDSLFYDRMAAAVAKPTTNEDTMALHGVVDYEIHGHGYASKRRTDPRIAIEPSTAMRAQRPAHLTPAIDGVAETARVADEGRPQGANAAESG